MLKELSQVGVSSVQTPGVPWTQHQVVEHQHECRYDPLLCVSVALKYDAAKEERYQQEAKHRDLQRIEEALQMAARKGETPDYLWPVADLG